MLSNQQPAIADDTTPLRRLTDWDGHQPLPSFRLGKEDLVTASDLMPSDHLGPCNPPYNTCYFGCPPCTAMAADGPRLRIVP